MVTISSCEGRRQDNTAISPSKELNVSIMSHECKGLPHYPSKPWLALAPCASTFEDRKEIRQGVFIMALGILHLNPQFAANLEGFV